MTPQIPASYINPMKSNHSYELFRTYLQDEFFRRVNKNPSYSLRSYAQYLSINDSTLSKILNSKMKISEKRFNELSVKFNLSLEEIQSFKQVNFSTIGEEKFKLLSSWYHFAILELIKTKHFKNNNKWIAQRLNININEVNSAIKRLTALSFITTNPDGKIQIKSPNNKWDGDQSLDFSIAHRNLQENFIRKSLETLYSIPPTEKENSSLTISCSREMLPEVKDKIKLFKKELDEYISSQGKHDDIYQMNISFFPLTSKLVNKINKET